LDKPHAREGARKRDKRTQRSSQKLLLGCSDYAAKRAPRGRVASTKDRPNSTQGPTKAAEPGDPAKLRFEGPLLLPIRARFSED